MAVEYEQLAICIMLHIAERRRRATRARVFMRRHNVLKRERAQSRSFAVFERARLSAYAYSNRQRDARRVRALSKLIDGIERLHVFETPNLGKLKRKLAERLVCVRVYSFDCERVELVFK